MLRSQGADAATARAAAAARTVPATASNAVAFAPKRPFLVFFRAGPGSLHERLLAEDPQRNWDCCVNWWSEQRGDGEGVDFYSEGGENKFDGFARLMESADFLDRYRYVLLADDDVYFRPGGISRLFELCERHALYLAQPALRWRTNVNHVVTARNPFCTVRRTSFVEVMTPVFSLRALVDLAPTFGLTRSTCGIDLAWSGLLREQGLISIVDAVSVEHTRPVDTQGGAWYRKLRSMGVDAYAESEDVKRRFPAFGRPRTLRSGHVYAARLPAALGAPLAAAADAGKHLLFGTRATLLRWRDRLRSAARPAR